MNELAPIERIEERIYIIRGKKVMLDRDLANFYGVETFNLNKAVKRNLERFPDDFMFQLAKEEINNLRFQIGMSSWGGRRYMPYVFTEQGVAMLSSVLNSKRAIQVNILIMRAFTKTRKYMLTHKEFAYKLRELEDRANKNDLEIGVLFKILRRMVEPPVKPGKKIGFV